MKSLSKILFVFVLCFFSFTNLLYANRTITASNYSNNTRINAPAVTSRDSVSYQRALNDKYSTLITKPVAYTMNECKTKYIEALDRECYNIANVSDGGLYSDCNDKSVTELYDVMDMQLAKMLGTTDFKRYQGECQAYKGAALEAWIPTKNIQEQAALKNSPECLFANSKLTAAKKCYSAALAHNGNSFEFNNLMNVTCGDHQDVALKFSKAGDLGLSNVAQLLTNYATLQFTNKSENWRQAVEAILAGYTYEAKEACGDKSYELLQLNEFTADQRTNLLTAATGSYASDYGSSLTSRMAAPVVSNLVGQVITSPQFTYQSGSVVKANSTYGVNSNYNSDVASLNNIIITDVYTIRDVPSITSARTKLESALLTGYSNSYSQDATDKAVAQGLAGLASYNTGSNLQAGNSFIIKQTNRVCQVLVVNINGSLVAISEAAAISDTKLRGYISDCERIIE